MSVWLFVINFNYSWYYFCAICEKSWKFLSQLFRSSIFCVLCYAIILFINPKYYTFNWNIIDSMLFDNFFFQARNLLDVSSMAVRGGSRIVATERSTAMFILRTSLTIVEWRDVTSPTPILVRYANTWRYVFWSS